MKLVLLYGAPASGKLTVATELAQITGYPLMDNHRLTDYVRELFPRRADPVVSRIGSRLGRKLRLDLFEGAAEANIDLISSFAPLSEGAFDFLRDVYARVEAAGGSVCLVQLAPDHDTLRKRVRGESRLGKKLDDLEIWDKITDANPEAFAPFPDREHLIIDNSDLSPVETARKIVEHYDLNFSTSSVEQV
jgi:chloramphenicol 3-O-phosphotransferase